ncbi:MAG: nucleotidyltransferase family protein [Anaerolineae bacterium]|nr:nucleotidyltransferase family protein [Anaerolineae bacterium]
MRAKRSNPPPRHPPPKEPSLFRLLLGAPLDLPPDWQAMVPLARRHGLAPLLAFRLKQQRDQIGAPAHVLDDLEQDYYGAVVRHTHVERQLAAILQALDAACVPVIVVKGLAFAAAYPDPALRTFGDLDVWVRPASLDRAEAALNDLGYQCLAPHGDLLLHHHLPPMLPDGEGVALDVHWRLDDGERGGRLPEEELWARATAWSVAGQPALRLDPVDAVLHLCRHAVVQNLLHGAVHSLFDLVYLTRGWEQAAWDSLARRAVDYRLARAVYLMLLLQGEGLGVAVPPGTLPALRPDGAAPPPAGLVGRLLLPDGLPGVHIPSTASRAWAQATLPARVGYLLQHVFPPPPAMVALCHVPAGSPRLWLAYLSRPLALLHQYGPVMWQALRGGAGARAAWQGDVWLQEWLRAEQLGDGNRS